MINHSKSSEVWNYPSKIWSVENQELYQLIEKLVWQEMEKPKQGQFHHPLN